MPLRTDTRTRSGGSFEPRARDAVDAHDDAVGALALLARLDEAGDVDVPGRAPAAPDAR